MFIPTEPPESSEKCAASASYQESHSENVAPMAPLQEYVQSVLDQCTKRVTLNGTLGRTLLHYTLGSDLICDCFSFCQDLLFFGLERCSFHFPSCFLWSSLIFLIFPLFSIGFPCFSIAFPHG